MSINDIQITEHCIAVRKAAILLDVHQRAGDLQALWKELENVRKHTVEAMFRVNSLTFDVPKTGTNIPKVGT